MTPQEQERQRRSFAYGNTKIENVDITEEAIERAADALAEGDLGSSSAGCPRCGIGQPGSARWSGGGPQPMSDAAAVATGWGPFAVLRMNRLGSSFGATCDQINDG